MSAIPPTPNRTADPYLDAVIARAERRRAKLERLSDVGMELVEEIRERNVKAPYHPEPKHDPSRAFASVSRAVRLTLVLEAKLDADIVAMRNGTWAPAAPRSESAESSVRRRRSRVDAAVRQAIDGEIADEGERDARERTYERLIESEDYEDYLALPWDDCLAAIRANLDLASGSLRSAVVLAAAIAPEEADETSALRTVVSRDVSPPGGAAASRPVDDPPCAQTSLSRPAWPITGPPPT